MSLDITQEEYLNKQESYDIIKNKVEAGISAKEELFQAEINQASSKAQLENSQVSYEDALDNLKILLGLSLHDEIDVLADVGKFVVEVDLDSPKGNCHRERPAQSRHSRCGRRIQGVS